MERDFLMDDLCELSIEQLQIIEGGFKIFGMSGGSIVSGILAGAGIGNAIGGPIGGIVGGFAGCAVSYIYDKF